MSHTKRISKERFITPQKINNPDKHSTKRLQAKTPPTVEPHTIYTDRGGKVLFDVDYSISRRKNTPYLGMSQVQLKDIVQQYDHKIGVLREYLRQSDMLERKRIAQIFGFSVRSDTAQKEVVLKELSSRVKSLIQQNNKLKSQSKYQLEVNMEYILKENKKLQMILQEYKNTEDRTYDRLRAQNNQLKNQIIQLNVKIQNQKEANSLKQSKIVYKQSPPQIVQKVVYKQSPPQIVQKVLYKQSPPQIVYKQAPPQVIEKVVLKQVPINNKQQLRVIQQKLGQYINSQSSILEEQNIRNFNKMGAIEARLINSEKLIDQYKKQRQFKIDSTIRKSFNLSMSLKKHTGEDNDPIPEPQPIQQKINTSNNISFGRPTQSMHISSPNMPTHTTTTIIQANHQKQRQLQDKLIMSQQKNKYLLTQIQNLKRFLGQSEQKGAEKVQKIIELQNQLNKAGSVNNVVEKQKSSTDQNFQEQVKNIKQTLIFCNTNNFQLFFNQFNEIIKQRNQMKLHLQDIKKIQNGLQLQTVKKRKQNIQFLQSKINNLTQQNMNLVKKISTLEEQVQNYHAQLITSQIQKLQTIQLSNMVPTGQKAIQWQKTVKSSIQSAINKLQLLQGKMAHKKKIMKITK